MTLPHEIGKTECVVCDNLASVRTNKKGKVYIYCDTDAGGCGTQVNLGIEPSERMKKDLINAIEKTMDTDQHGCRATDGPEVIRIGGHGPT